jgi:hypothetical protein
VIKFEFLVDENSLKEDLSANPSIEDLAVLQETFFVFPTRLNINGNEMFSLTPKKVVMYGGQSACNLDVGNQEIENPWIPLPLLHLALIGFGQVKKACEGEETSYSLPGTGAKLIFVPILNRIEISSTLNGKVERSECQELIEAFNHFKAKVFYFLKKRVPIMEQHPEWDKICNYLHTA